MRIPIKHAEYGYYFYCRECKKDHVFAYSEKFETQETPCGLKFVGIKDKTVKELNKQIITGCLWRWDGDGFYRTLCGKTFFFDSGNVGENDFKYCPYCGKKIQVKK